VGFGLVREDRVQSFKSLDGHQSDLVKLAKGVEPCVLLEEVSLEKDNVAFYTRGTSDLNGDTMHVNP
jgi:hypothetical protein